MNWKEFLKPDWKKIFSMIIIFILSYIFIPSAFFTYDVVGDISCFLLVVGGKCKGIEVRQEFNGIYAFFTAIISYLLSCLIVWIYNKARKK
jgi:hypothetical protein